MGEVLAHAAFDAQHFFNRSCDIGGAALIGELAIDPRSQVSHSIDYRPPIRKAWAQESVDIAGRPDVARGAGILNGFESFSAAVCTKLSRNVVPACRAFRLDRRRSLNFDLRAGMYYELGVILLDGNNRGGSPP